MSQSAFGGVGAIARDGPVGLMDFAVAKHIVEPCQGLGGFCEYDQAGHRPVKSVSDPQKHIARLGVSFFEPSLYDFAQRSVACLVALHYLANLLVDDNDMIVFVDYIHSLINLYSRSYAILVKMSSGE